MGVMNVYKIVKKRMLSSNIFLMDIEAPRVAKSAKPGQFVIVKMDDKGERIPLTICDYDAEDVYKRQFGTSTLPIGLRGDFTGYFCGTENRTKNSSEMYKPCAISDPPSVRTGIGTGVAAILF